MRRAGRTAGPRGVLALCFGAVLIAGVACGSNDAKTTIATSANADTAVRFGIEAVTERLGETWHEPPHPWFVDETITHRCGDARAILDPSGAGLVEAGTSPTLRPVEEEAQEGTPAATSPPPGSETSSSATIPEVRLSDHYGNVRVSVLVYADDVSARAALERLTPAALEECFVAATNQYLDNDPGRADLVPDATADSFMTRSAPFAVGDEARLTGVSFEEDVIGGSDNSHDAVWFVGRSGSVIATALAVSNSQAGEPENPATLARTLGVVALERAVSASPDG